MASIGGQAVLEGVMMRGPSSWAVAVRRPDGRISEVEHDVDSVALRRRWLRLPVVRGVVALGESLAIGMRALAVSARFSVTDEGEEDASEELGKFAPDRLVRVRDRLLARALQGLAGAAHELDQPGQHVASSCSSRAGSASAC